MEWIGSIVIFLAGVIVGWYFGTKNNRNNTEDIIQDKNWSNERGYF